MSLLSTLKLTKPRRGRLFWLPSLLACLAAIAFAIDVPLAKWFADHRLPGDFKEIFTVAETFGHGIGAVWMLIAVWALAPQRRKTIPHMLAASVGAGLVANLAKLMISRALPRAVEIGSTSVFDTFGSMFPFFDAGAVGQSFPSAHAATAVGLAVALAVSFPRGRPLYAATAVLACVSRMTVGAHYLSDVLLGAAIGLVIGRLSMQSIPRASIARTPNGQIGRLKNAA